MYVCECECVRGGPQYRLTESSCQPTMCVSDWRCLIVKCRLYCRYMEEKHRSAKKFPADKSKANPGSQNQSQLTPGCLLKAAINVKIPANQTSTSQAAAITAGIQNKHASWKALKLPNAQ